MLDFFSFKEDFFDFLVLSPPPPPPPPKFIFLSLYLILNEFAPIVEKLDVRLLLAALMAVMMSINAKIPRAMITIVMADRNLFPLILVQESDKESI